MTPRKALNKLKWTPGMCLSKAEIWFVHRGAPGDVKVISGSEITDLGPRFFNTSEAAIPYHRILKIVHEDEVIFERKKKGLLAH